MLGSLHDAEDALQEALLRAWRGLAALRGPQRAALVAVPDRDQHLPRPDRASGPKRVLPIDHGPPPDAHDGPGHAADGVGLDRAVPRRPARPVDGRAAPEARYEQRESVELAFVAALQHLPAAPARGADPARGARLLRPRGRRRARDERAARSTAPCSAPARRSTSTLPERSQQETLRTLGDDASREIVEGYMEAWERGDVDAVAAMLAEDAALTMPPMATWFRGRRACASSCASGRSPGACTTPRAAATCACCPRAPTGSPRSAPTPGTTRRGALPADRAAGPDAARRPHRGDHRLRVARQLFGRFGLPERL